MTRLLMEKLVSNIEEFGFPWKHQLSYLLAHDAEQRADIESLSNLLDAANKELLARAKKIGELQVEYEERIEQLQADLDQVVGESVWAGEQLQFERASGWADVYDCAVNDDLVNGQLSGDTVYQRAESLLRSPLVQSWRVRQGKEGV